MDFLEKQILAQREALDQIERVDEGLLWQNIQAELQPPKEVKTARRFSLLQVYAIAASVALIMMAGWMFLQKENTIEGTPEEIANVDQFIPDFEEKKALVKEVSEKKSDVDFQSIDRQEYPHIFEELDMLEKVHTEFLKDIPRIADRETKVEILQKYYERKIRILERLSKEIEKKSHYEKRINEKPM